jgi:hypothetical protein
VNGEREDTEYEHEDDWGSEEESGLTERSSEIAPPNVER